MRWSRFTVGIPSARLFSVVVCVAALASAAYAQPRMSVTPMPHHSAYPTPYGAVVPAGVEIPVTLTNRIDSGTVEVGDSFQFSTAKDEMLGDVAVAKGTQGHGRVASVIHATNKHDGDVTLQADSIDLADGTPVWVDIDPKNKLHGHLADKHTHFYIVAISTSYSGNLILDPGTAFTVTTIPRRAEPAPLMTEMPTPAATPT